MLEFQGKGKTEWDLKHRKKHKPIKRRKGANGKTKSSTKQLTTSQPQSQFVDRKQRDCKNKKKKKRRKPAAVNGKTKSTSQKLVTPQSQSMVDQKIWYDWHYWIYVVYCFVDRVFDDIKIK